MNIIQNIKTKKELDLYYSENKCAKSVTFSSKHMDDTVVEEFTKKYIQLEDIALVNNPYFTEKSLESIAKNCASIVKLQLYALTSIKNIEQIADESLKIQKLILGDLANVKSSSLEFLGKNCFSLKKITIYLQWNFTLDSVEKFLDFQCSLDTIQLIGNRLIDDTDISFFEKLKKIHKIYLRCCPISDVFVEKLKGDKIKKLKFINTRITEKSFEYLKNSFPNLEKVVLKNNSKIPEVALKSFAESSNFIVKYK